MKLLAVSVGRPHVLTKNGRRYSTSINKQPVAGPVEVGPDGVAGDRVSDTSVHGGPDNTICVFPHEHYEWLSQRLAEARGTPRPALTPAAFGENFTTFGLLETDVCIGDVFRVGTATVQVTQPRQPCYKLAGKHDEPRIIEWIYEAGFCGFYFRVLTPGAVTAGDALTRVAAGERELTIASVLRAVRNPAANRALLERLAANTVTAARLRTWADTKLSPESEREAPASD